MWSTGGFDAGFLEDLFGLFPGGPGIVFECVQKGFSARRKSDFGDGGKEFQVGDEWLVVDVDFEDSGGDFGWGIEVFCSNFTDDFRFSVNLDREAEHRVVTIGGADFFGDLFLNEENYGCGFLFFVTARHEEMAEEGGGDVVGNIGNEFVRLCGKRCFEGVAFFEVKVGSCAEGLFEDGMQGGVEFNGTDAAGRLDELLSEDA